jgi:hypothetical protein
MGGNALVLLYEQAQRGKAQAVPTFGEEFFRLVRQRVGAYGATLSHRQQPR